MTLNKARKITALDIQQTGDHDWAAVDAHGNTIASASYRKQSIALTLLVSKVLQIRNREIMERQQWRCFLCGEIKPLQGHHLVKRSKGRSDVGENLVGLCSSCHDKVERGEVKLQNSTKER